MSKLKAISKAREIELLSELMNSDSYLAGNLHDEGIEQMIQNIKNDHCIENDAFCTLSKSDKMQLKINILEAKNNKFSETLQQMADDHKRDLAKARLCNKHHLSIILVNLLKMWEHIEPANDNTFLFAALSEYSNETIVKAKIKNNIELTSNEINFVLSNLEGAVK